MLTQTANKHQLETMSKHVSETASLAEHLTQLKVKDKEDEQEVLNSIIQVLTISDESEREKADTRLNPDIISKGGRRVSYESLKTEASVSGALSRYALE